MGLAASQARLLFITLRQNDVSAQMQRVSNDTMVLARDKDIVAEKYEQMLNEKSYKLKDDVDLSYDALMGGTAIDSLGNVNIVTNNDGRVVLSGADKTKYGLTADVCNKGDLAKIYPTVDDFIKQADPTNAEAIIAAKPATTSSADGATDASELTETDIRKLDNFVSVYGKYPQNETDIQLSTLLKNMGKFNIVNNDDIHDGTDDGIAWHSTNQNNDVFNADKRAGDAKKGNTSIWNLNQYSFEDIVNPKGDDITMIIADDGDKRGVPKEQAKSNFMFLSNKVLDALADALGLSSSEGLKASTKAYTDSVCKNIDARNYNNPGSGKDDKQYQLGRDNCLAGNLISGGVDTTCTNRDAFMLNVSELCRELIAISLSSITGMDVTKGFSGDYADLYQTFGSLLGYSEEELNSGLADGFTLGSLKNVSKIKLDMDSWQTIVTNDKGYSVEQWEKLVTNLLGADKLEAAIDRCSTKKSTSSNKSTGVVTNAQKYKCYEALYNNINNYGWSVEDTSSIQEKLKNGTYRLNGTALANNEDLYEEVSSTDSTAKAEAYWKVEMQKISTKEKKLETELTKLQTEYSSLTSDYESVNSIIQKNISRSFTYCQNG